MPVKRQTVRSKACRKDKKRPRPRRDRKITASAGGDTHELIRMDRKKMEARPRTSRKFSTNGQVRKDATMKRSASAPIFKHPKAELEAAIQRYVDLFDFAPIAYVSFNHVGRIEEINLVAAQLLGRSRDRLIGEPFALHVTKKDGALFLNHLLRCRSSDSRVETELHLKKRNGEIILAHLASSPMTSSMRDGVLFYQTAIVDLTERKRAEEAIRQSEERYRTLFNLGPMAVYTIDTSGVIKDFNRRAAELWGREPALGDTDQRFCGSFKMFRPDGSFMPHHHCPMAEVVLGKVSAVHNGEVLIERPDGSYVTVLVNIRPLKNDRGEVTGAINCFYDITERKRAEQHLLVRDAVSRALAQSGSLKEAAPRIIQAVCDVAGWEAGALWDVNHAADELYCVDFWHRPSFRVPAFEAASRQLTCRRGIGLPGRVWLSGKPVWVPDVTRDDNFQRARYAVKDGLHAGLCLPIKLGNRLLGMVECFSREIREPDNDLLQMFASVGSQIGQFVERKKAEQALAETARQQVALYEFSRRHQDGKTLDGIYEAALDATLTALPCDRASILLYDHQQVMRFVAWRGLSKKYRKAVEGHSPWEPDAKNPQPVCIADVDLADIPKSLKSTIRTEGIRAVAFIPLISSRTLIGKFMTYYNTPHQFTNNELKLATTIARQLAQAIQHRHDEKALRESEERNRAIVSQSAAGIVNWDLTGRLTFVNHNFCQMLGYKESELIGKTIRELTHAEDIAENMRLFHRLVRQGASYYLEKRFIRKGGSYVWATTSASPILDAAGKVQSVAVVVVDTTARKRAEAALQKSMEMLEQLVEQRTKALSAANAELKNEIERRKGLEGDILAISDREQQRLGQELHDGLCQHLTAVAFMARSVALRLRNHRVIEVSDIEKIAELVNNAAADTRNLSRALHRVDVDAPGLVNALRDLVDREIWKIPCRLEIRPSFHIEDDAAAAQLYRIAREAVINANKHAQAREIVVKLERSRQGIVLRVVDDGVGFSNEPKLKRGLGFHIMKYRAQVTGGRLEIDCPKQGGTCVSCYLPNGIRPTRKKENVRSRRLPAKITKVFAPVV
jgi:PAS domain S-box-containing protein